MVMLCQQKIWIVFSINNINSYNTGNASPVNSGFVVYDNTKIRVTDVTRILIIKKDNLW